MTTTVRLTESCREIVSWATRGGTKTLGTRDLLVAIMSADSEADWQRVWLYAGAPEQLRAALVSEADGTVERAFEVADAVRSTYRADAVTPAMLALGLVGVPGSGAAQAVRQQGGIGPDRFADLAAAAVAAAGVGLLTFGYGRALLAMPASDRRPATRVDTALLAVAAAGMPALLLGWLGWAMLGSGDHAARHGTKVEVVETGWCGRIETRVNVCRRAAWTGAGAGLHRGTFYYDRLDARPGKREYDPKAVPAYAIGNRAFGPHHVGTIDPIVVLAPAAPWLGLAVPIVVLATVTVYWRRTPRGA